MSSDNRMLETRLESLRRYIRRIFLVDGLSRVTKGAVIVLVAAIALDWWLRLPGGARLVILIACAVAFAREIYVRLLAPAAVPLTIDDAAVAVEREYPSLADKVISAVQLRREVESPDAPISRSLVEALRADAEVAAEHLDFRRVIEIDEVRNRAITAFTLLFGLVLSSVLLHSSAEIAFARFFNPFTEARWPHRTKLELDGGDFLVARGEGLSIAALTSGRIPKRAYLEYKYAGQEEFSREGMGRLESGRFQVEFKSVPESFSYRVVAGDNHSMTHKVRVVDRPALDSISVRCSYPGYTGLPSGVVAMGHGNVRAVVGTRAVFEAKANKELKSATLVTEAGSKPIKLNEKGDGFLLELGEPVADGSERRLVTKDTTYEVALVCADGFENKNVRYRYTVTAVPDEAPEVSVADPGEDLDVSPNALVPIEARCTDEFGVKTAHIAFTKGSKQEDDSKADFEKVNLGQREVVGTLKWDLQELDLTPGMVLSYSAVAADGHEMDGKAQPNIGRSTEYHLRVLSAEEIAMRLERAKMDLRNEVARIRKLQEETGDLVDEVREVLAETDRFALPERQKAITAESAQSALARRSGMAAKMAERIERDLRNNRMLSTTDEERLGEVG